MAQAPWHFATSHVSFTETLDPIHLWDKFAKIVGIDDSLRAGLGEELYNSLTYQSGSRLSSRHVNTKTG